jgi:cyclopropane fatty-acyl-phospholipid synthase-like methyltransferase
MGSLPPAYFDALYKSDPDPWKFETSTYEADKYAATLAALPRPRYHFALEVGCSIGVLTQALAGRCNRLLAIDVAEAAIAKAKTRLQCMHNVHFACRAFPGEISGDALREGFDLIILSEMLYYLDPPALMRAARVTKSIAAPDAEVLLVHWLGPTPDYPLTGDAAAEAFIGAMRPAASIVLQSTTADYRIDLLRL